MPDARTIEIDIEVHKRIESERASFAETPNDILRRLLKLNGDAVPKPMPQTASGPMPQESNTNQVRSWSDDGVVLPHGTLVRMTYNGRTHEGRISNGSWHVEGQHFHSASAAACGVAQTRSGRNPSLNGWIYWEVKRPGDSDWVKLNDLRSRPGRAWRPPGTDGRRPLGVASVRPGG
jgi:hypothetical protein